MQTVTISPKYQVVIPLAVYSIILIVVPWLISFITLRFMFYHIFVSVMLIQRAINGNKYGATEA